MKVGSENTCGHEGYAKKQEWLSKAKIMTKLSKAKIMTKLSKAKIKAKARMARNLRNLFGTYPFDYTPHNTRHK